MSSRSQRATHAKQVLRIEVWLK